MKGIHHLDINHLNPAGAEAGIFEENYENTITAHAPSPFTATLIPAWISNYIHYKLWYEITNPFLNFNNATVEV